MSNQRSDFEIIRDEICELHQRWNLIEDLYTDESTIDLLNECAPAAFSVIFDAFVDLVIVGITRLVDQDQRALTLNSLARHYKGSQLGKSLARILKDVRRHSRPLVSHRNKRIAHHDADVAGSPRATKRTQVEVDPKNWTAQ